ncbi:MAG: endonuclease domain-containing protein [Oscillospiraceae bacterium]|nr:endonuclease domain-containing protein [Oscillospiraceae bacterium]
MLARQLRSKATREENMLWYDLLSKYPVRFLRQRPIGRYIADFYCPTRKLVIEVDGKQHELADAKEYDAIRTDFFNCLGIEVIRFSNEDIKNRWVYVRDVIEAHVPVSPVLSPTPAGGGKGGVPIG